MLEQLDDSTEGKTRTNEEGHRNHKDVIGSAELTEGEYAGSRNQPVHAKGIIVIYWLRSALGFSLSFICISASNVDNLEREGASNRTGKIIGELLHQRAPWVDFELVKLSSIGLEPCIMCGRCLGSNQCPYDPSFNQLFSKITEATGIFLVIPHYALIPAKLTIILEKLQEFAYLHSYNELPGPFVLTGKPVGLVVHGGMLENSQVIKHYEKTLLEPVANAVKGVGLRIVSANRDNSKGVVFGIKKTIKPAGKCLPEFEYQWTTITKRLSVLVASMLKTVEETK